MAPLALPGVEPGRLWVKRDDLSCPLYGGSKPRKLELLLADARARGARRVVTAGGLGTHHGLATALLARRLGIATSVVLVDQPWTPHVQRQLLRMAAAGAELRAARSLPGAALAAARVWLRARAHGERPLWLPVGGSSPVGAVGFVSAAFELAEQIEAGELPAPAEIFVALGSGGTLAGLVLGAKLAGLSAPVTGVLVTDRLAPTPRRLSRLARATLRLLRRRAPAIPEVALSPADFRIRREQLGAGYGAPTAAARACVEAARAAGLELETTYTGKCLAAACARLREPGGSGPLLFWHSYSAVAPPAEPIPPRALKNLQAPARAPPPSRLTFRERL